MAINKGKVATELGAALLQPSIDIAGKAQPLRWGGV